MSPILLLEEKTFMHRRHLLQLPLGFKPAASD